MKHHDIHSRHAHLPLRCWRGETRLSRRRGWRYIRWIIIAAAVAFGIAVGMLAGCADPSTDATYLPPAQAAELRVWADQHPNVWFDLRAPIHNERTCPWISGIPNWIRTAGDPVARAWFDHWFWGEKHEQENHCRCEAAIVETLKSSPTSKPVLIPAKGD